MTGEPATGAPQWRDRQPLSGADLTDFLALRRICGDPDSRAEQVAGQYVEHGRPVLPCIADGISVLLDIGHATLGEPDPVSGTSCPVLVTATGRARYEQLCDQQGIQPYPTVLPEPGTEYRRVWPVARNPCPPDVCWTDLQGRPQFLRHGPDDGGG